MFGYYGSKTNIAKLYPPPKENTIIEPFAGAAKYSLLHWQKEVILIDKYPVIIRIWKYLQSCSVKDIQGLPRSMKQGERLSDLNLSDEEKMFLGFMIGSGPERPRDKAPERKTTQRPNHLNYGLSRVEKDLFKIKHWQIREGSYTDAPNIKGTWFIDPPYQFGGEVYPMSNKTINYADLAIWSKSREGQVIVCENSKADWMDFKPIIKQRGSVHTTTEMIFSNHPTNYDSVQQKLFT